MPVRPHHHRLPRAHVDPIDERAPALALLVRSLADPAVHETVVLVLDDAHRGVALVTVSGTDQPDHVIEVVEFIARPESQRGPAAALVVASVRPDGGIVEGDGDRWLEMCDLAEAGGLELVEWFVIGRGVSCPRDLLAVPPRWPGARPD